MTTMNEWMMMMKPISIHCHNSIKQTKHKYKKVDTVCVRERERVPTTVTAAVMMMMIRIVTQMKCVDIWIHTHRTAIWL